MHRVDPFDPGIAVALSGFEKKTKVFRNFEAPRLYEEAIRRGEAEIADGGALVAATGAHTGRSPHDKFIVRDDLTRASIWWENSQAMTPEHFECLHADMIAHARAMDLFAQDLHGAAEPRRRLKVRVYTEYAWHSLFIRNLLIRPPKSELAGFVPDLAILDLPSFRADPKRHGCRSQTVIAIDFSCGIVLIGGTSYAGEIKKAVFGYLNFLLPPKGVLPMHCSANADGENDTALFFGLSGTGKTTLSADASRSTSALKVHDARLVALMNVSGVRQILKYNTDDFARFGVEALHSSAAAV